MGKNFNGTQINNSATISEKAGAEIADCRNRILKYDGNGDVVLATAGTFRLALPLLKPDITTFPELSPVK